MTKELEVKTENDVLFITLNRHGKGNSLYFELVKEITQVITEASVKAALRAIVFTSAGKNFCTGADLDWVGADDGQDFVAFQKMYEAFYHCDLPLIGLIPGKAIGAGVGLAACFDVAIAAEDSTFALPEVRWGLIPGALTPLVIRRIGVSKFNYWSMLSSTLHASEAASWGLIHEVVPPAGLRSRLETVLAEIVPKPTGALRALKKGARICQPIDSDVFSTLANMSGAQKKSLDAQKRIADFRSSNKAKD